MNNQITQKVFEQTIEDAIRTENNEITRVAFHCFKLAQRMVVQAQRPTVGINAEELLKQLRKRLGIDEPTPNGKSGDLSEKIIRTVWIDINEVILSLSQSNEGIKSDRRELRSKILARISSLQYKTIGNENSFDKRLADSLVALFEATTLPQPPSAKEAVEWDKVRSSYYAVNMKYQMPFVEWLKKNYNPPTKK